ncbi:Armadillo-like helical [Phytophthora cactorum]|nr:Armadillo-like helical [Phytophthora cactorum]
MAGAAKLERKVILCAPSPQYNPATYMREVVGDGIDCDVNDYSMEYKNSELNKSSRGLKELAKKQRLQSAGSMATLSESVLNQVQMARKGALPALLEITKVGYHAEISRHISCSFANLSSNPENHLGVFSLQEFRAAFTLAQSAEEFLWMWRRDIRYVLQCWGASTSTNS